MEEKKITVEYSQENMRVRIDATMKKNAVGWYCDQVHAVKIDNLVLDFDKENPDDYMFACLFLEEEPFEAVEAMYLDEDYTEMISGHGFDPWDDAGVSPKDFLWSSQE